MLIAALGVIAALAFVLGLGAICLWALKRFGAGALASKTRVPLEVVQRIPLGPKTGLAVVRVGERVMALSVGEGGVRQLFELDEADRQRVIATSTLAMPMHSSPEAAASFASTRSTSFGAQLPGKFGAMFRRSLESQAMLDAAARSAPSVPSARTVAVTPFTLSEPSEVPAFLTAPVTTSRGTVLTYGPRATAASDRDFRAMLGVSLSGAARLTVLAGAMIVMGNTSVQAQSVTTAVPATTAPTTLTAPTPPQAPAAPDAAARATAALPAPVGTDEAIMRLMPQMDMKLGGDGDTGGLRLSGTIGIVVMMGLLTLLPTLLLMMTGFTRILIVLHFLKQAMGTQSAPPAHLLAGLALLLTGFVMTPTLTQVNKEAITPWLDGKMTQVDMMKTGVKPMRTFMLRQTRDSDLKTFIEMSRMPRPNTVDDVPLHVLMSAFVASELRTAFQIGFAIYLPFIIIDAVVASVLMSMGMFMLPPAMISLPFKLLLFVLVDGWSLTITSLVQSFK